MFKRKNNKNEEIEKLTGLIVSDKTNINIIEQFRTIQTNINFSMFDHDLKSIVITSANRDSGKTFLSMNLAALFAKENFKVLLVDADLRKPRIHKHFELSNKTGLTNIIRNPNPKVEEYIYKIEIPGLYLLTSGVLPPNPSEILNSNRMSELIKKLEKKYDLVIFDSPPVLPVVDTQIIASKVGGTIFVIPIEEVTKDEVIKSKKILNLAEAKMIGVVFNKTKRSTDNYY